MANVPYELHYHVTTVDAPETVNYCKSIPGIIFDYNYYSDGSPKTMWNLIPKKGMPPTRLVRYCCSNLKENIGTGTLLVTGVRWDESINRKKNADVISIFSKSKKLRQVLEGSQRLYKVNKSGGIILNFDNESVRDDADFVHQCYVNHHVTVQPIIDWSDRDVWDFLNYYGCKSNPLYQCGFSRIGCIGCPMSGSKQMEHEFYLYPKYKANYIRAFSRMLVVRDISKNTPFSWVSGEDVYNWWINDDTIDGQLSFFDDDIDYGLEVI